MNSNKAIYITLILLLFFLFSFGQGQYNNWYFGIGVGINFSNDSLHCLDSSQQYSLEACASISDSAGNLLFYTNGEKVWDRNNNVMPNGIGLLAWGDVQQGTLIVPKPGSDHLYYIFTIGNPQGPYTKDFRYSIVDMNLNSSMGDITMKNILMDSDVTEKLTATRHLNGNDYWIVEKNYHTNEFKSFLLTEDSLSTIPIVSAVGSNSGFTGAIKISNQGCWMISTIREPNGMLELFHFNNSNGTISGSASIPILAPYGLEFSPDGTKFYVGHNTKLPLEQFDLLAGNDSMILSSETSVSDTMSATFSLQLAPNDKIYMLDVPSSNYPIPIIGVINSPNSLGFACDVLPNDTINCQGICTSCLPNNFNLTYTGTLSCSNENGVIEIDDKYLMTISPNPTTTSIQFHLPSNHSTMLTLFNLLGEKVKEETTTGGDITVDVSELPAGMYVVRAGEWSGKFVKE